MRERLRKDGSVSLRHVGSLNVRADNGTLSRISASGTTKAEALRLCREKAHVEKGRTGLPRLLKMALGDYLERWLTMYVEGEVEATTLTQYRNIIRRHVIPHVGNLRIADLSKLNVRELFLMQRAAGASTRTNQLSYRILKQCFSLGVNLGELPSNPCSLLKMPKHEQRHFSPVTAEQCKQLSAAAKCNRLYALYVLALTTGMRQGELFGLQWPHLNGNRLSIRRQVRNISGLHPEIVDRTKNGKGREVTIPAIAIAALDGHPRNLSGERLDTNAEALIFPDRDGGLLRRENFVGRNFRPLLLLAELTRIRFHDLRHSCATLAFIANVHPKIVQELLGYHSVAFTLNVYSASVPGMGAIVVQDCCSLRDLSTHGAQNHHLADCPTNRCHLYL